MLWKCPSCLVQVPVEVFPVHCGCGFTQYENPPGKGDLVAIGLVKVGITENRYKKLKQSVGLKGNCRCKKRQHWLNGLLRKAAHDGD